MFVTGCARAFPPHYYSQTELYTAMAQMWQNGPHNPSRLQALHQSVSVGGRHIALPLPQYAALQDFTACNRAYIEVGAALAEDVTRAALADAQVTAEDIDHIFFVTVTGIATPALDAMLCNRLEFRADVKRTPIFGLGCVAGAAGLARAADYVRAFTSHRALLVSVELCSLTLQREDFSVANLIASGLFGDGAAAVVIAGDQCAQRKPANSTAGPRICASRSVFYKNTEHVLGWTVSSAGFRIVLSGEIPQLLGTHIAADVASFLAEHSLDQSDLVSYICHPGGPKVMDTLHDTLQLEAHALDLTRAHLAEFGNLSSASVLMLLQDTINKNPGKPGSYSLLLAFGPGFCCELVLLQW